MIKGGVLILDFGSQYNQLIARRIREMDVYAEVHPFNIKVNLIKEMQPAAIILSGGPSSVFGEEAYLSDPKIFELNIPILGICYGMQLMTHQLGGIVAKGVKGEYGKARLTVDFAGKLMEHTSEEFTCWMSHFDEVKTIPQGFKQTAHSQGIIAGMEEASRGFYAVQFHPEVAHTEYGTEILKNFVLGVAQAEKNWFMGDFIEQEKKKIKEIVGDDHVLLGLSGGVDSSVAAVLIHEAIGDQLTCVFVDTGLLRLDEAQAVMKNYGEHFHINIIKVDAQERFYHKLKGITDPEEKRKIIGREFIEVFDEESSKLKGIKYLAQGTIYPDVIESISVKGPSATIKSHHNVGGLPEKMNLKLLEPLRELFKDEVRKVGEKLGIPHHLVYRHPFPGPGLGIRILGEITPEKVTVLQKADDIFIKELIKSGLYDQVSQAFAVLLPIQSVGVMGDARTYENVLALRSANTTDFMTAHWSHLPYDFLEHVSNRIINEVKGINRVVYDISNKPPATIEWE